MELEPNLKNMASEEHLIRVSDQKLGSWEEQSGANLGFGGVYDELGYVVLRSTSFG